MRPVPAVLLAALAGLAGVSTPAVGQPEMADLPPLIGLGAPPRAAFTKWQNAFETFCRADAEKYEQFQTRLNKRMNALGSEGWELVGVVNTPLNSKDCLAFAYRRPRPR